MGTQDLATLAIPGLVDVVEIGGRHRLLRAREQAGERTVAVRLLDVEADDRFEYAVLALEALSQHPHAVTVYGSGCGEDGRGYVLLELLEEGSLGEWVATHGRLPCAEVLDVILKIAGALETAHRAGVVHGDLRAEQILVSAHGEPRLAGLDRAVFRCVEATIESAPHPLVCDDVQALGALMLTLLTAWSPGDDLPEMALKRCGIPPSLQTLICRCLDGDPALRPATAAELATALQRVQTEVGLTPTAFWIIQAAADDAREALREAAALPPWPTVLQEATASESAPEQTAEERSTLEPVAEPEPEPRLAVEPEPEEISEPAPEPVASEPSPPSPPRRWSSRRLLVTGLVALAASGVAVATRAEAPDEPPAQEVAPVVLEDQPVSDTAAVYEGFRAVMDETGRLSMIVPREWRTLASSPWTLGDRTVGRQLEATIAGQGDVNRPGAVLALSETLGRDRTVEQVLDELRIADGVCRYARREPFNDNLYAGAIDSYTGCGAAGSEVEILVATPADGSRIVMLRITRVGPRDVTARNRVVETFNVRVSA